MIFPCYILFWPFKGACIPGNVDLDASIVVFGIGSPLSACPSCVEPDLPLVMSDIEALIGISAGSLGILHPAFLVLQQMTLSYNRIRFARRRCKAVIRRSAFIIKGVHQALSKSQVSTLSNIAELQGYVHTSEPELGHCHLSDRGIWCTPLI